MNYFALIALLALIACISTEPMCEEFNFAKDLNRKAIREHHEIGEKLKEKTAPLFTEHQRSRKSLFDILKDVAGVFKEMKFSSFSLYNMYLLAKQHVVKEMEKPAMCLLKESLAEAPVNDRSPSKCNVLRTSLHILFLAVKGDQDEMKKKVKEALPCYKLLFSKELCDHNCQNVLTHELKEQDLVQIGKTFREDEDEVAAHWKYSAAVNQSKKSNRNFEGKIEKYSDQFRSNLSNTRRKREIGFILFTILFFIAREILVQCGLFIWRLWDRYRGNNVAHNVQLLHIQVHPVPYPVLPPPIVYANRGRTGGHPVPNPVLPPPIVYANRGRTGGHPVPNPVLPPHTEVLHRGSADVNSDTNMAVPRNHGVQRRRPTTVHPINHLDGSRNTVPGEYDLDRPGTSSEPLPHERNNGSDELD